MINQEDRKKPKPFIDRALQIFKERNGTTIVEIGSMRDFLRHDINDYSYPCCNDGHSSIILALESKDFYTVDIEKRHSEITDFSLKKAGLNNAKVLNDDGIDFLEQFIKPIDLLFLDAWDVGTLNYAENHLKAYLAARKNLHFKSLILIDDTDVLDQNGEFFLTDGLEGKGKLLISEAIKDGWKIVFTGRVTCLDRS